MNINYIEKLFNFKDKIILISGTSGLLGSSLTKLFLELGSKVIGIDIKKQNIKHKNFFHLSFDISNEKKVKDSLKKIIKQFKKIDVIINNAGISFFTKFEQRTKLEMNKTFNVNIIGTINLCKNYFILHKKLSLKQCKIINIGSIYGSLSPDFRIYGKKDNFNSEVYGITKAGVTQLTKYLAAMMASNNINVNCMSPGGILNEKNKQNKKFINKYSKRVPMNRMAKVNDFHTCILFLASENSNYITGQNILIDGGLSTW